MATKVRLSTVVVEGTKSSSSYASVGYQSGFSKALVIVYSAGSPLPDHSGNTSVVVTGISSSCTEWKVENLYFGHSGTVKSSFSVTRKTDGSIFIAGYGDRYTVIWFN